MKLTVLQPLCSSLSFSVGLPSRFLSLNPTSLHFVFVCFSSLALPLCSHLVFLCLSTWFFSSNPFFPLTVILSSHPSFFYSCCQISLSTLGKLHFSDYTPIKDPVGTLFACCILSLETEKWTVSERVLVCVCSKKSYLKYSRLKKAYVRVCVCVIADGSPLLNPY